VIRQLSVFTQMKIANATGSFLREICQI